MEASDKLAWAIAAAGLMVGGAIYYRQDAARYQGFAVGPDIMRLDTRTGAVIGCDATDCVLMIDPERPLRRNPNHKTMVEEVLGNKS